MRVRSPVAVNHHLVVDVMAVSAHFKGLEHRLIPFSLPLEENKFIASEKDNYRSKNSVGIVAVPFRVSPEELLGHLEERILSIEVVSEAHPIVVVVVVESVVVVSVEELRIELSVHHVVVVVVVVVTVEASRKLVVVKSVVSVERSSHPVIAVEVVSWAHAVSVVVHPVALVVVLIHPLVVVSVVVAHPVVVVAVEVSRVLVVVESIVSVE